MKKAVNLSQGERAAVAIVVLVLRLLACAVLAWAITAIFGLTLATWQSVLLIVVLFLFFPS